MISLLEHEACTKRAPDVAPDEHRERARFGEPIHSHSHSHSHSQSKPLRTYPSQGQEIGAGNAASPIVLRPYQANAVQNCRIALAGGGATGDDLLSNRFRENGDRDGAYSWRAPEA